MALQKMRALSFWNQGPKLPSKGLAYFDPDDLFVSYFVQNKLDIREEAPDATAMRMMNELRVLKYKPNEDP